MVIGYCRVSTQHQKITRQVSNINEVYPEALMIKEFYTGTTQERPLWEKLMGTIQSGDTIVFDSVSRMSRNSEEGFKDYKKLYEMGVNLEFLNEPLINTSVLKASQDNLLNISIETGNEVIDDFFKNFNKLGGKGSTIVAIAQRACHKSANGQNPGIDPLLLAAMTCA